MTRGYHLRAVKDSSEWEACFKAISFPHLMQAWPYGEAKEHAACWHVRRLVFERSNTPIAICQVLEVRAIGLRLASRINRGPMFLETEPSGEDKENVYRLLRAQSRVITGGPLLIAPALPATEENEHILDGLGFKRRKNTGWCSSLIDLYQDESVLRARLARNWRNQLRKAQNAGIVLEAMSSTGLLEFMLDMHARNMAEKNFVGPKVELIKALYEARPDDFLILKATLDDEPIAALAVVGFGASSECYVGWFGGSRGRQVSVGNFIYWEAVLAMKKAGRRWLDLGGYYSSDKFGHFKQGMGGNEYRLVGEYLAY